MQERNRKQQQTLAIGGPSIDEDDASGGLVTVIHAPYSERLPVGEMSIRYVRETFRDRLGIHPESVAFVDGQPVDDDTVVGEGQRLMFMRPSGEKGSDDA